MKKGPERSLGVGRARSYLLVALAAMTWGCWPVILHDVKATPGMQSLVFMIVTTIASVPVLFFDRRRVRATRAQWLGVAWLGVADAMNVMLFFAAYRHTTVAIAVLTHYLTPILVALTAPFALGERLRARTYAAVAIAFAGLVLLLEPWNALHGLEGALYGAGSAVFYASNVLVNKRLSPVFSAPELMFFHGLVAIPFLLLFVGPLSVSRPDLVTLGLGALGPGTLAGLMFVWGLRAVPASHASVLTLLEPLVAVILGAAVLNERMGGPSLLGGLAILAGAVTVVSSRPDSP